MKIDINSLGIKLKKKIKEEINFENNMNFKLENTKSNFNGVLGFSPQKNYLLEKSLEKKMAFIIKWLN